jgi:hypothetical protein
MSKYSRADILLSLQRALLGEVSSYLRQVTVDWDNEEIIIRCYFNGPISDIDRESMECVHTSVIADFFPEHSVDLEIIRKDAPAPIGTRGAVVYARREYAAD